MLITLIPGSAGVKKPHTTRPGMCTDSTWLFLLWSFPLSPAMDNVVTLAQTAHEVNSGRAKLAN